MKIKYFSERQRANGTVFVVNPPAYVKNTTGMQYKQFSDKAEAVAYSLLVAEAFQDSRRGKKTPIYVDDTSVQGLINHYKTTEEWLKLKTNSKTHYRLMFRTSTEVHVGRSNKAFGEVYAKNVTSQMADSFYQSVKNQYTHHRANSSVKVMRRVWNICIRHGKVPSNPFTMMEMQQLPTRKTKWEREEVELAIKTCDAMELPNLGTFILMCYHMCQRPIDIRQMKWEHFNGQTFNFTQEKTGVELWIDASEGIQERLSKHTHRPRDGYIVTNDENGLPYDRFNYSKQLRRVREEAGLRSDITMADLRRTGATEMGESGCTEDEIMSVTGHTSRDIVSTYVRKSQKMATNAMNKRFG